MFTGLIENVGEVAAVTPTASGLQLRVTTTLARELAAGDSLAVNGVCLTVVSAEGEGVQADVSPETVRVTSLGSVTPGTQVNLERPLRADGRIGGHFVQGHVDGTGTVDEVRQQGGAYWVTVRYPEPLKPFIVRKGSIAVNGISLTVAGVDDSCFHVQVIPFTWTHTTLRQTRTGELVNIECDILGKYVARALEAQR